MSKVSFFPASLLPPQRQATQPNSLNNWEPTQISAQNLLKKSRTEFLLRSNLKLRNLYKRCHFKMLSFCTEPKGGVAESKCREFLDFLSWKIPF